MRLTARRDENKGIYLMRLYVSIKLIESESCVVNETYVNPSNIQSNIIL